MMLDENNKLLLMYLKNFSFYFIIIYICATCCLFVSAKDDVCSYDLVVTMPANLTYDIELKNSYAKTHEVYLDLINNAKESIHISTFELTLLRGSTQIDDKFHESMLPGEQIVEALVNAASKRGVYVEILYGLKGCTCSYEESSLLNAGIKLKYLDNSKLLGRGIQHTKLLIVDNKNFYVGSANWDWQSFTQVKEMGISFKNCLPLAVDLNKIYKIWSMISDTNKIPEKLPKNLLTKFNKDKPFQLKMDNLNTQIFLATSPKAFDGTNNNRTGDLEAILDIIDRAEKFVYISVMNYNPVRRNSPFNVWSAIDDAIKKAMWTKNIDVKLLVSVKTNNFISLANLGMLKNLDKFRKSLQSNDNNNNNESGGSIEVKLFRVPAFDDFQNSLPYSRIKHDKYVVTDNSAYIGTSNWEPDYFENTCGVGVSIKPDPIEMKNSENNVVSKLIEVFERDYYSKYAKYATDYNR